MEAGNDAVASLHGIPWYGARTFNAIQRALATDIALTLARLFETGRARGGAEIASTPRLVRLLRDAGLKSEISSRARGWVVGLEGYHARAAGAAELSAIDKYQTLQGKSRLELEALRAFRTDKLAHSLHDVTAKTLPTYGVLSALLVESASIVAQAYIAILGRYWEPTDTSAAIADEANLFWHKALSAQARKIPAEDLNPTTASDRMSVAAPPQSQPRR